MQGRKLESACKNGDFICSNYDNEYYNQDIIFAIMTMLYEMTNRNDRVFFMKFSLGLPLTCNDHNARNDDALYKFIYSLMAYCRHKMYDPRCLWTKENTTIGHVNYHFMFLFNYDFVGAVYLILEKSTELWANALNIKDGQGLVNLCNPEHNIKYFRDFIQHGGVLLEKKGRYFNESYIHCFNLASYMAMRSNNDGSRTYVNEYGCL